MMVTLAKEVRRVRKDVFAILFTTSDVHFGWMKEITWPAATAPPQLASLGDLEQLPRIHTTTLTSDKTFYEKYKKGEI